MRKLTAFLLALCLVSCGTSLTAEQKAAERQAVRTQVADSVNNLTFRLVFNYVLPRRMQPRHLMTDYALSLHGDSVDSYLPYFGVAYRSDFFNNDRSPLSFTGKAFDVVARRHKKDAYRVSFRVKHGEELLGYDVMVFANGKASLNVQSSDREAIDFQGDMVLEPRR